MIGLKNSYEIAYNGTENECRFELYADSAADLQGLTNFDGIKIQMGSECKDIATGDKYILNGSGVWVLQPSDRTFSNVYTKAEIDSMITEIYDIIEYYHTTLVSDTGEITFYSLGGNVGTWAIYGNGQQTGTPTPDAPIMPTFCGVRTGNLFDYVSYFDSTFTNYNQYFDYADLQLSANTTYTLSTSYTEAGTNPKNTSFIVSNPNDAPTTARGGISSTSPITITTGIDGKLRLYKRISGVSEHPTKSQFDNGEWLMLNLGSTALPYEPFGWAEKITCAGQTVPVYIGQTQTVRKVKKKVFDGTEYWSVTGSEASQRFYILEMDALAKPPFAFCTHFTYGKATNNMEFDITASLAVRFNNSGEWATVDEWKAYLASEYAAGHPVTIWYVLAEPETAIVNEPLAKIGTYADELHSTDAAVTIPTVKGDNVLTVGTILKPSLIEISGGYHA